FCGLSPNQFDADLYRVRRVRAHVRVQAESRELRGIDRRRFFSPGGSRGGERWAADYAISLEVAPRNLNLGR
ncbi:MAG: hypothetical protein ACRD1T_15220, partial [Acidimicrobiia bacterium]